MYVCIYIYIHIQCVCVCVCVRVCVCVCVDVCALCVWMCKHVFHRIYAIQQEATWLIFFFFLFFFLMHPATQPLLWALPAAEVFCSCRKGMLSTHTHTLSLSHIHTLLWALPAADEGVKAGTPGPSRSSPLSACSSGIFIFYFFKGPGNKGSGKVSPKQNCYINSI